ncbi:MAG: hypothetical protein R3Y11_07155 [Pseudomonadota bacterium]
MNDAFSMTYRHRRGHVYIQMSGAFSGDAAKNLLQLIDEQRPEGGRAFVDTKNIAFVATNSKIAIQEALQVSNTANEQVFFKGEQGLSMAPQGCRVLISPESKSSCSACAKCKSRAACVGTTSTSIN